MLLLGLLVLGTLWLGWSNGGNDNFKGVATLYGSRTLSYRAALAWSTVATVAGSLLSIVLANGLVRAFSGYGVISASLINDSSLAAVGQAAAATILLATLLGMPTSTTHALTGALVGVALVADPSGIDTRVLLSQFAQPLLLSPFVAIGLTANFMTAILVLGASRLGLPVSTTHVSCGAIFGISAANGRRNGRTIALILATWLTTLPMGLALGAGLFGLLQSLGV